MPKPIFIEEQPVKVDFVTVRGDDRNLSLTYTEEDGRPIDLSKATGTFEIQDKDGMLLTELNSKNKLVKLGKGKIDVVLADSELKLLNDDKYRYIFKIVQDKKSKTLFAGTLTFWQPDGKK